MATAPSAGGGNSEPEGARPASATAEKRDGAKNNAHAVAEKLRQR